MKPTLLRLVAGTAPPCAIAIMLGACGSRGPLDTDVIIIEADGSISAADAAAAKDARDGGHEAAPDPFNQLLDCGLCVTQKCASKVQRCAADPTCTQVLQCVVTQCVAGGLNQNCLGKCTQDPSAALKAFEILQCVTGVCGDACGGGLPPGLLGGF